MKKFTTTVTKIGLLMALSVMSTLACTQEEALNKMMAIGRVQQAMAIETSNDDKEKTLTKMLSNLNTDMQTINETYMLKDEYENACSAYDSVVEKYNIDMEKASKDMLTVEELKKDGGKNGGSCSIADAAIKMMGITEKMQKLMNNADIAMEEFVEFSAKHEKILPLMSTNPSKYCDELDNITKTYIKE